MGGWPSEVSEELVTQEKRKKGWRMNCDVGEATEGLENELWRRWSDGKGWSMSRATIESAKLENMKLVSTEIETPRICPVEKMKEK